MKHLKLLLMTGAILNIIAFIFSKKIICFNAAGFLFVFYWLETIKEEIKLTR
jgi:hypothetical protein